MLHSLLAWTMGLGSLGLFASGFFLPEIRRKNDLIWSGIGLFYALVMTVDSGRLRGGMILEELASVILIVWFALQILKQRRRSAPPEKLTPLPNSMETWTTFLKEGWGRLQKSFSDPDALEALFAEEDEDSLIDISKLSATITGLFNKGNTERSSSAASSAPTATTTDTEDWGDENATSAADSSAASVDTIATAVADTEEAATAVDESTSATSEPEQIEEEVATDVPTAEAPPEPDVSGEPVESTAAEMGDRTEGEASAGQVAEPEAPEPKPSAESETTIEDAESSSEEGTRSESWPPPDAPT